VLLLSISGWLRDAGARPAAWWQSLDKGLDASSVRTMTRLQKAILLVAFAVPLGLVGATAFNPDSGWAVRSALLWHVFGGTFEIGLPLIVLFTLFAAVRIVLVRRGSRSA
jgi:hypothetical protein